MELNTIHHGDWREWLATLPDRSVHCCVTSPPYWGLRDYGTPGQLGLEKTPEEYVAALVDGFREVRRVLRDDGTVFLNLGDSYAGSGKGAWDRTDAQKEVYVPKPGGPQTHCKTPGLKPKDLVGIPWRVAFALQADGWWLRSDVIWSKPNPMPESVSGSRWEQHRVKVKAQGHVMNHQRSQHGGNPSPPHPDNGIVRDAAEWRDCPGCPKCEPNDGLVLRRGSWRPTKAHEYIFLLAKSANYFCDAEAVKDGCISTPRTREKGNGESAVDTKLRGYGSHCGTYSSGRNRRSVWTVTTAPFKGSHFAVFPPKLIEPCILAGTSERGCCPACGAPWVRVVKRVTNTEERKAAGKNEAAYQRGRVTPRGADAGDFHDLGTVENTTIGWRPSCSCDAGEPVPCVVMDPFMGAGTTALVAWRNLRHYIGCELNPEYVAMAERRLGNAQAKQALFAGVSP